MRMLNAKDLAAGLIFICIGVLFCVVALSTLNVGEPSRMGPGFFPILAGGLVILLGIAICVKGVGHENTEFGAVPWRGLILISVAPIVFGICIRGLGLGPTAALTSIITCFASYKVGPVRAVVITAVLTAFCLAVFHYGLGLPIPVIGPWLQV
jgi:hypothetical protein